MDTKNVQCWEIHSFPGEIHPMANSSPCEKFCSVSNRNVLGSKWHPLPLTFSVWIPAKKESQSFLYPHFGHSNIVIRSPLSFLFPRLNKPRSQPFLTWKSSQLFAHLFGSSLNSVHPVWIFFFCPVGTNMEHNIPEVIWQTLSRAG